jgi:cytochrome c biogenesis protein CcmG/thiol:disulfide interchange protein DsbE
MRWKFIVLYTLFCGTFAWAQTPDLALPALNGNIERLSDFQGRIVILNFWATWCAPCQKEMPTLVGVHAAYARRGVEIVAASVDDAETRGNVPGFVRRYRIPFHVWLEATEKQQASFRLATGLPATAIIDRDGQTRFRIIGEVTRDVLVERLEWLLSTRTTPAPSELVLPAGITPEHFREHELGLEDEHEEEEQAGSEVPS